MRTFTLICDRCKKSETVNALNNSKLELVRIGVGIESDRCYGSIPMASLKNAQEWCLACRTELGLTYRTEEEKATKPDPTTEDQLLEVLRCFVQENTPSQ